MFQVKCPICKGLLTIDTRSRSVVSHTSPENLGKSSEERFESVLDTLRKAESERDRKMAEAKEREAKRAVQLDELFRKAKEKAQEEGEDKKPLGPVWD